MLHPPQCFALVEPGVFRSAVFTPANHAFLKTLQLKSVIYLSLEAPTRTMRTFLEEMKIELRHQGLKTWKPDFDWKPVNEEMVKESLEFILNSKNTPVLVMCASGVHETGAVIGCLRRFQRWSVTAALHEYELFAGPRSWASDQTIIEHFDADTVTVPPSPPSWLSDQQTMMAEEEFTLGSREQTKEEAPAKAETTTVTTTTTITTAAAAAIPSYQLYMFVEGCKLVSDRAKFDKKVSIVIEDDD